MIVTRVDDICRWFSAALVEQIRFVLMMISYNFVGFVVANLQKIGGLVWDEFLREKVSVSIEVGEVDAVSRVGG